jgi:hypothetical protein
MYTDTCPSCESQVTHQPVATYLDYCPYDDGSFQMTADPDPPESDEHEFGTIIAHLNEGKSFSESHDPRVINPRVMDEMWENYSQASEVAPELKSTATEAESEAWLTEDKEWDARMGFKAMALVPQIYVNYVNGEEDEGKFSEDSLNVLINKFEELEKANRAQNGPEIELAPHEKRLLAVVTLSMWKDPKPWRLAAYRVFHYYLRSGPGDQYSDEEGAIDSDDEGEGSSDGE